MCQYTLHSSLVVANAELVFMSSFSNDNRNSSKDLDIPRDKQCIGSYRKIEYISTHEWIKIRWKRLRTVARVSIALFANYSIKFSLSSLVDESIVLMRDLERLLQEHVRAKLFLIAWHQKLGVSNIFPGFADKMSSNSGISAIYEASMQWKRSLWSSSAITEIPWWTTLMDLIVHALYTRELFAMIQSRWAVFLCLDDPSSVFLRYDLA